jgi:hypothetical protein
MTDDTAIPFASKTLLEHLVRGLIGIGAISLAVSLGNPGGPWWSIPSALILGGVAIVAFRGCPICWTMGLIATVAHVFRRATHSDPGPSS